MDTATRHSGSSGLREPEYYTLPNDFVQAHHDVTSSWHKVRLRGLEAELAAFKNEAGFELIAQRLGIARPSKVRQ